VSNFYTPGSSVSLTLNLEDGATGLFPTAYIFSNGALETSLDLADVGLGRYSGTWTPGVVPKNYDALFIIYTDALHSIESVVYTREMEKWQPDTLIAVAINRAGLPVDVADAVWDTLLAAHTAAGSAGEFLGRLTAARAAAIDTTATRAALIEKILRNRLELSDGAASNWVLYDDDSVTPLLTFNVKDKNGAGIIQQALVPSRRSRGV
jgi:hypothetical protein